MLILFGGAAYLAAQLDPLPPRFGGVAKTADGDSFRIAGERVRLLGIDAPELDQVCWRPDGSEWPCGRAAKDRLVALLGGGALSCQPSGTDKYGRTLAHCVAGGRDVGAAMVEAGLAVAKSEYQGEELAARNAARGIWDGRFIDPRQWRDDGPSSDPGPDLFEALWNWFRELTGARTLR